MNKATAFRGVGQEVVLDSLEELHRMLIEDSGTPEEFSTNNDNRTGRDLRGVRTGRDIEIKIGSATNAAWGISTMEMILRPEITHSFPDKTGRGLRARKVSDALDAIYYSGKRTHVVKDPSVLGAEPHLPEDLDTELRDHFRSELLSSIATINSSFLHFTEEGNRILSMTAAGATKAADFKRHLLEEHLVFAPYITYTLTASRGVLTWVRTETPALNIDSEWSFSASLSRDGKNRLNFLFQSEAFKIRTTLNQKNSHNIKDSAGNTLLKLGYPYGLGPTSFNVWVDNIG